MIKMSQSIQARNKALVLEAFDTLFNQRDYSGAERYWTPDYVQHSAHIPPGREGFLNLILYPGLEKNPETQAAVRAAMAGNQGPQHEMRDVISVVGEALKADSGDEQVKAYQAAQQKAPAELQFFGNPWRITDFLTLGSPLAHTTRCLLIRGTGIKRISTRWPVMTWSESFRSQRCGKRSPCHICDNK